MKRTPLSILATLVLLPISSRGDVGVVHPMAVIIGPLTTGTIPAGSKGWTLAVLSGSATFMGVTVPVGFSDSDSYTLSTPIIYTTGTNSTLYVRFNTFVSP